MAFLNRLEALVASYRAEVASPREHLSLLRWQVAQRHALDDRATMPGHVTTSAIVLSPDHARVLLIDHVTIGRWLQPGGVLILQTPNAVFLPKRIKMAFGFNPFERIRQTANNPGHFREYTLAELVEIVHAAGYTVVSSSRKNYFSPSNPLLRLLYSTDALWPPSFRAGITMVLRNGG